MSSWRYKPVFRKMTILESVCHFIWKLKWVRVDVTYEILTEGDDGYEEAPYESTVVFHEEVMTIKSKRL